MVLLTDDYLEHHGVLGQKWGVRRYQNKDGSLTAAGKKRLSTGSGNSLAGAVERYKARRAAKANVKAKLAKQKQAEEAGHEDFQKARAKKPKQMSTSELKEATDRLKLESQYAELAKKLHKETPKEYLKRVAITTAKAQGEQVAAYMMGKAINKMFGAEVIKGLATKQNVDAGKKMAEEIKKEVPTAPGALDKAKAKIKEQYNKAVDRDAEKVRAMSQKVKDEQNKEATRVRNYSDFETSFYDRPSYSGAPTYKLRTDTPSNSTSKKSGTDLALEAWRKRERERTSSGRNADSTIDDIMTFSIPDDLNKKRR